MPDALGVTAPVVIRPGLSVGRFAGQEVVGGDQHRVGYRFVGCFQGAPASRSPIAPADGQPAMR